MEYSCLRKLLFFLALVLPLLGGANAAHSQTVTLSLGASSIGENGGSTTVTATVSPASATAFTVTVSAGAGVTLGSNTMLSFAANATSSTGTVTITAVNNSVDAPDRSVTVSGTTTDPEVTAPDAVTLTVTDDEAAPTVTLSLSPASIGENGGSTTVTASLSHASSQTTTVTVSALALPPAVAGDFALSMNKALTIAAGQTSSSGTVTITANDNTVDAPNKAVRVSATANNSQGVTAPSSRTLTITDNEAAPAATLVLSQASISENGGSTTVTATLSHASSVATTVTVSALALPPAVAGDFALSANRILTIAAGQTSSTGTVTITANDNTVDAPNKAVRVSASASNSRGVTGPSSRTLTITDNEAAPAATLVLSQASISENGGSTTVTATLSHASSVATTVTVSALALPPAVAGDFALSANRILTIAAGQTSSTGTVTITANDNNVDAPDKAVRVSASVSNSRGVIAPSTRTLAITDNEAAPAATLMLSPASISENGGSTTVTATLSHASSVATTVTVSALALPPAVAGDFALSANRILTIAAGQTSSAGTVTITANDNNVDAPDKAVRVSASVSNSRGVIAPSTRTLAITDNEAAPAATLVLSPASISENGGSTTVTATLSHASSVATTVTVSAVAVPPAVAGDFALSMNKTLTITAGQTSSSGTVTITANNNTVDAPDKEVAVSGAVSGSSVTAPDNVTLTITDDEATPKVTLSLSAASVGENGGSTTVTASLNHASSQTTTVTISAVAVSPAAAGDFALSTNKTLSIAAGQTSSSGTVRITANDNDVDAPDKRVTVSGSASNGHAVTNPDNVTLTITDNEATPKVTLVLSPASIGENGGSTTVTATLSGKSSQATTVDILATAVSPAAPADFSLSTNVRLSIAAGQTSSTGMVRITANDNAVDAPNKAVTVAGSAANSHAVTAPDEVTLTIADNEAAPTVTLSLSATSIGENGGSTTVTASLNHASSEATTVDVSATAVSPAVPGDFALSTNVRLTIAAGQTSSAGTVTITANNNDVDAPNKSVTVSGSASNTQGIAAPSSRTLTITDDDAAPTVTLSLSAASIDEDTGSATVTASLNHASSATTTVTVSATAVPPAVAGDFMLSANRMLTIAAGQTTSTGTVTITPVNNSADTPNKAVTVAGSAANMQGITNPSSKTLTILDDEGAPSVTLSLSATSIGENGGSTTVTATLNHASSQATTVDVSATAVSPATAADFSLSTNVRLTIMAGQTSSSGTVTITANDNTVDAPNKEVTVSGSASNTQGINNPANLTLTITDNEAAPAVTLSLSAASIGENGGSSRVTASLNHASSQATTVTVSAAAVSPAVAGDFSLSTNRILSIAAGQTSSTGTVTVRANDNNVDAPNKQVTVSATVSNTQGIAQPASLTLTITDNEAAPTVTLVLSPSTIGENAGVSRVTARLSHSSSAATTVTVSAAAVAPAVPGDFTLGGTTTLSIPANAVRSTGATTITAVDNNVDAPHKTVTVSATAFNGQGVTGPASVSLTIADNEASRTLAVSDARIQEGGALEFIVRLSGPVAGDVTVSWESQDGSATNPADYISASGTLTFAAGTTSLTRTVTVQTASDAVSEGEETLSLQLSSPTVTGGLTVTLQASASRGTGTIVDDAEAAGTARKSRVNDVIAPRAAQRVASSTLSAVMGRIDAATSGLFGGSVSTLPGRSNTLQALKANAEALKHGRISLEQALGGSSFVLQLAGAEKGKSAGVGDFAIWGSGDYGRFSGKEGSALEWEGSLWSFHFGADMRVRRDVVAGFAMSQSNGAFDYIDTTDPLRVGGRYRIGVTSFNPYVAWSASPGSTLWATLGFGAGGIEFDDGVTGRDASALRMYTAAAGFSRDVFSSGDPAADGGKMRVRLKGYGSFSWLYIMGSGRIDRLTSKTRRFGLSVEGSNERKLETGERVTASLEAGVRHDGGDAVTGYGVELGGRLRFVDPRLGLTVEGYGRYLATHSADFDEWGVGGTVRLASGSDGKGLSLRLGPRWGTTASGVDALWSAPARESPAAAAEPAVAGIDMQVGYGWGLPARTGVLTPWTGASLNGAGARAYRLGVRFEDGPSLRLSIEGIRSETGSSVPTDHSVILKGDLRF